MTVHVALLRAVNLGAHNKIGMSDLCGFFTDLKLGDPRSVLQSGNVVFRSTGPTGARLERTLEAEAETRLGLRTDFFVRTAEEWKALIARNPFPDQADRDPAHLVVMCLKEAPGVDAVKGLQAAITGPELVQAEGKQAYIVYPDGIGHSRLTTAIIEKKLGTRGTGRNWNTALKLGALASANEESS